MEAFIRQEKGPSGQKILPLRFPLFSPPLRREPAQKGLFTAEVGINKGVSTWDNNRARSMNRTKRILKHLTSLHRMLAFILAATLILPTPVWALREPSTSEKKAEVLAGLEEALKETHDTPRLAQSPVPPSITIPTFRPVASPRSTVETAGLEEFRPEHLRLLVQEATRFPMIGEGYLTRIYPFPGRSDLVVKVPKTYFEVVRTMWSAGEKLLGIPLGARRLIRRQVDSYRLVQERGAGVFARFRLYELPYGRLSYVVVQQRGDATVGEELRRLGLTTASTDTSGAKRIIGENLELRQRSLEQGLWELVDNFTVNNTYVIESGRRVQRITDAGEVTSSMPSPNQMARKEQWSVTRDLPTIHADLSPWYTQQVDQRFGQLSEESLVRIWNSRGPQPMDFQIADEAIRHFLSVTNLSGDREGFSRRPSDLPVELAVEVYEDRDGEKRISMDSIPPGATRTLLETVGAERARGKIFMTGGAVIDLLLGFQPKVYDLLPLDDTVNLAFLAEISGSHFSQGGKHGLFDGVPLETWGTYQDLHHSLRFASVLSIDTMIVGFDDKSADPFLEDRLSGYGDLLFLIARRVGHRDRVERSFITRAASKIVRLQLLPTSDTYETMLESTNKIRRWLQESQYHDREDERKVVAAFELWESHWQKTLGGKTAESVQAGLEEDVEQWIQGLGIWSKALEPRQLAGLEAGNPVVAEVREVPAVVRLTSIVQGVAPSAEISRSRQVLVQPGILSDQTMASLEEQFGAVERLPRTLDAQGIATLATRLRELDPQGPKALLILDSYMAERLKAGLEEFDPEWKAPAVIVGIPSGLLVNADPDAVLSFLLDLLARKDSLPGRHMAGLEATFTPQSKRQALFLTTGT